MIVEAADFLTFARISGEPSDDVTLYIEAATALAEGRGQCGPLLQREVTRQVTSRGVLTLPLYPVASVTSLTGIDSGATYVTADLLALEDGVVALADGSNLATGRYTVTWVAGRWAAAADVPGDVKLGILIITKHLWEAQRGAGRTGAFGGSQEMDVPAGFALPRRAAELLAPYAQVAVG